LFQLKIISARNLLRGVLPKGSYGRYLWVQVHWHWQAHFTQQADVKIVATGI